MNGYPGQYSSRPYPAPNNASNLMDLSADGMDGFGLGQGQSLDSIVAQNDQENNRRRSMPVFARNPQMNTMGSPDARRLSIMNFGDHNGGDMDDYQFNMSNAPMDGMMRGSTTFPRTSIDMQPDRLPTTELAINTQYQAQNSPFSAMNGPGSAYASPMHQKNSLDMSMTAFSNGMNMPLDMDDSLNIMPTDMNMYPPSRFNASMMTSPIQQDFVGPQPAPSQDNTVSAMQRPKLHQNRSMSSHTPETRSAGSGFQSRAGSQDQSSIPSRPQSEQHSSTNVPTRMSLTSMKNQQPIAQDPGQDLSQETINKQFNNANLPIKPPPGGFPSTMHSNPHMKTEFRNAYSATGFDMLGVLVCSVPYFKTHLLISHN